MNMLWFVEATRVGALRDRLVAWELTVTVDTLMANEEERTFKKRASG